MYCLTRLAIGSCFIFVASLHAAGPGAGSLPRGTPESQGVSSAGVLSFVEALDRIEGMHSVMLVRHGKVIAEGWWTPYDAESNHELYSLSKSFTSAAVGFAVAEGRLSIDDPVLKFFPEEAPAEPGNNLKAMRVRDLLTMSAGHQDESPLAPDKISARAFLAQAVPHKPGTHFRYNTPATFMLSAIVQKQTGQTMSDFLRPRLFEPLGISRPLWNTNWQGISLGGYGLSVRTEDIARFGQFHLQKGRWKGKQRLPPEWVELATSRQVSNGSDPRSDWDQGYGFQFWRCRHNAYRGDGAFGQYCLVLPEQDAVLAITSGVKDMQAVLNVVWDHLLPAFKNRRSSDPAARKRLAEKLAGLKVPTAAGAATAPAAAEVFGKTFSFPTNTRDIASLTLRPDPAGTGLLMKVVAGFGTLQMPCGFGRWLRGRGTLESATEIPLAACVAWPSADTCVVKICATETPFCWTWQLRFAGDEVQFDAEANVGFGPTKRPQLIGRIEK